MNRVDPSERWNDVRSAANVSVDQSPAAPLLQNRDVLWVVKIDIIWVILDHQPPQQGARACMLRSRGTEVA